VGGVMEKFKFKIIEGQMDSSPATAVRQTTCCACGEDIPEEGPCIWVSDEGVFHVDCVEKVDDGGE